MEKHKPTLFNALKYLIIALPLLFGAPIVVTIGFKALKLDGSFFILLIGIMLALVAMIVTAMGIIKIGRYFFDKGTDED
ncbi:MAG: DUF6095 family protein [Aureibaculum sp.]|jgi:hypothetical protein